MTFNPDTPAPLESPANTASPIQVNFAQFASIFSNTIGGIVYNHMPFNDLNGNQGKHGAVIFQEQSGDPGIIGDMIALYNKQASSALGSQDQLFVQIPQFLPTDTDPTPAPNDPMQLTYNQVNTSAPIYQSFLIGGYLIYFGSATSSGSNPTTATITLSPMPTKILCAQAYPQVLGQNIWVTINTPTKFTISSTNAPALSTFLWMAIAQS
jgi:hypothetical protein